MSETTDSPTPAGFLNPQVLSCPFDFYQLMHREEPVAHVPELGFYLVSRYEDVVMVLKDYDTFSSQVADKFTSGLSMNPTRPAVEAVLAQGYPHVDSLAWLDPPAHTRQQTMVNEALTPRRVRQLEGEILRSAEDLVAVMPDDGVVDLVRQFSAPLPVATIAAALGMDRQDLGLLAIWSDAVLNRLGKVLTEDEDISNARLVVEFQHFMVGLIEERERGRRDDLLGDLIKANMQDEQPLSLPELLSLILTLLVAGNHTTRSLISSLIHELVQRPETLARVRHDRSLVDPLIQETLRLQSPVPVFPRLTTRDVEICGVTIPAGELVMPMFHAANVDARRFPEPSEFRLDRDNAKSHLAFSFGLHYCPGATLARREAEIALNVLLDNFRDLRLSSPVSPQYEANFQMRQLPSLEIHVTR